MYTCTACKKPIEDMENFVIVTDAHLFNNGEVEHQNTEHFHADCVKIDY
jgi:hypothetical protein